MLTRAINGVEIYRHMRFQEERIQRQLPYAYTIKNTNRSDHENADETISYRTSSEVDLRWSICIGPTGKVTREAILAVHTSNTTAGRLDESDGRLDHGL